MCASVCVYVFAVSTAPPLPSNVSLAVGGGYDNESIALTAMCLTFYCWVRSLRPEAGCEDGRATRYITPAPPPHPHSAPRIRSPPPPGGWP